MGEETSIVSRLLYGDRKANRQQGAKLLEMFGVPLTAWDEATKITRRKHIAPQSGTDVTAAVARAS